ncbi:MAG TPA: acyl-CoA reductase [Candidatus Krumholzibacteria bacterium]|nr:acyl-CoA reductase [Candidatus Krumholzibacteria bacterium]
MLGSASQQPADAESRELEAALLEWMASAPAGFVAAGPTLAACYGLDTAAMQAQEQRFESLALALFAYQYERVDTYRAHARALGASPSTVQRAQEVPPLPVEALRHTRVATFPAEAECARFHTSGTTGRPGVVHLDSLALYDLSLGRSFGHHVLPDVERIRMLFLVAPWSETPHSSLGYMLEQVRRRWGTPTSAPCIRAGRLQWNELRQACAEAVAAGEPVCLLGTAFAFVEMLDAAAASRWSVQLPPGSRVFETGGTKGRTRELSRPALREALGRHLGVPTTHVVSEYGMTELASQYYTLSLRSALLGTAAVTDEEVWSMPFWLRPRLLDASTGTCRAPHEAGGPALLAHHDLGNRATVAHFLTADLGEARGASFILHGRCPRSELRGCGLMHEHLERDGDAKNRDTSQRDTTRRDTADAEAGTARFQPAESDFVILPHSYHLPARPAPVGWRPLGASELQVPVLAAEGVTHAWQELEAAATVWRSRSFPARLEHLADALGKLRARGPGPWRQALALSAALSPAGLDAAWEVTFAPHAAESLAAAWAQEGLDVARLEQLEREGRLPRRLVHILAGNVLPPTLSVLLRGWLLGAAQWLRPARREPLFAVFLLEDLATLVPELAASTAVLWWPHAEDVMQTAVLSAADLVTVQGSDVAIAAVQKQLASLPRPPRCLDYGSRWSGALVSIQGQNAATAAALARDVALFDQLGCLSPTLVFAEAGPGLEAWCATLAAALASVEKEWPRGPLPATAQAALRHWHETVRLEQALGAVHGFWEQSILWGVVLLRRCETHDTPLDRHVVVVPFTDVKEIAAALGEELGRLQGLAVALEGWESSRRDVALEVLRPSRLAPVGELQQAPLSWAQDHRAPFASLLLSGR